LISGTAYADNAEFHATAAGSVATTDNVNGSETDPKGSLFTDIRPGMLFTYNAPRMIHELTTEVDFFYYFGRTTPNVTFRGDWKAFFLTGPRSELSLDATGSTGQLNALQASTPSDESPLLVRPTGKVNTNNAAANENGSWIATKFTRIYERGFTRYTTTDNSDLDAPVSTRSFHAGGGLGLDHRLRRDNFSIELGGAYVYLERRGDPNMEDREDKQVNPRAIAVWQHDFTKELSTSLDAGAEYVNPIYSLTGDTQARVFPIFGITGAYTDVWGRAQVSARRAVTPNLFIAQNTITDSANATFAMPLSFLDKDARRRAPRVVGIGSVGINRTQLITPADAQLTGRFLVGRVDGTVAWQPRPGQTLGLRAELTYQDGDQIGEMYTPSYHRFTFYFTFALRWPEDVQVRVPRRQNSVRADQSDLAPIGAEPVVIDPAELLEEGGR
jgi:hypothetical protein